MGNALASRLSFAVFRLIGGFMADGVLAFECPEEGKILETPADLEALDTLQCSQITRRLTLRGEAISKV